MREKVKGILFDLAGTIVHSRYREAISFICEKLKVENQKEIISEFLKELKEIIYCQKEFKPILDITSSSFSKFGIKLSTNEIFNFYKQYIEEKTFVFEDALNFLENLKEKDLKLGIISNSDDKIVEYTLKFHDLKKFFNFIVTSEKAKSYKPNKRIIELAIKLYQEKPENLILIGNSHVDIKTAKNFNIFSILILRSRKELQKVFEVKPNLIVFDLRTLNDLL